MFGHVFKDLAEEEKTFHASDNVSSQDYNELRSENPRAVKEHQHDCLKIKVWRELAIDKMIKTFLFQNKKLCVSRYFKVQRYA
ncbi:hypothetical protein NPIL_491641 [Nephila pilipes]|uniref:Uncharacterized protein n=1 Tax=Nephila pilipes TaxID=299642 RepID=A0A8X6UAT9_NEPPI|nr:hypothetical protein NPIL_491641 [Nephila pilipes]